jgi:hypothetical protein
VSTSDTPYDPDPNLAPAHEADEDDWDDVPITPRARVPRPTKLLAVLVVAAVAFAGGVFSQRHWGSTSQGGSAGGNSTAAARFSGAGGLARQGSARRIGGGFGAGTGGTSGTGGGAAGGLADATIGQVAYLKGATLYVTDASGNIVKVSVAKGTPVTKSVSTGLKGVRPGDTVVIRGTRAGNGTVSARSVSVGGATGSGLFGGGG